jgi:hypothetical protein
MWVNLSLEHQKVIQQESMVEEDFSHPGAILQFIKNLIHDSRHHSRKSKFDLCAHKEIKKTEQNCLQPRGISPNTFIFADRYILITSHHHTPQREVVCNSTLVSKAPILSLPCPVIYRQIAHDPDNSSKIVPRSLFSKGSQVAFPVLGCVWILSMAARPSNRALRIFADNTRLTSIVRPLPGNGPLSLD